MTDVADPESELPKMTFLDHLEELRKRLMWSFIAVAVGFLACWAFAEPIFAKLQEPLTNFLPPGDKLAYTRLTAPFFLYMKVAFFAGLFVASPFVLYQLWMFISPGLYKRERRLAAPFIILGTLFFVMGGYFGYRYLLPATCSFFVETGKQFKQMITVDDYFSFASVIILATGCVFETPILIFFLARLGIVTPAFLMQKFKYAVVLAFIISAIITPTPDMVTQAALAVPMILLYLLGTGVAFVFGKKHE
ncbi:MAG TPA: twin-arginine translocase subunit TatC [Thermoanaerobaculia bacterium]|jgi:sec-independent protein translocase protein TatC|nr:twin-arginine translocase subunit TatC [Thermoanaerobaculia bacterium]